MKYNLIHISKKWFVKLILLSTICWLLAVVAIYLFQESLLFYPSPLNSYKKFNLPYTSEVFIQVDDAKIHGLYLKQPENKSRGIILFLHGNAGNLTTWFVHPEFWLSTDYDVLMIDYRGFGKSTGKIQSEIQLQNDVLAAWQFIIKNYAHKKKIIYGRSLGTGLAAHLATQVSADLVVLVSPFQSMQEMARQYYSWVPSFVLRYPLRTDINIQKINSPILLLHGDQDTFITIEHSQYLLQLNSNAHLITIHGAAHNDIHEFPEYLNQLREALKNLSASSP